MSNTKISKFAKMSSIVLLSVSLVACGTSKKQETSQSSNSLPTPTKSTSYTFGEYLEKGPKTQIWYLTEQISKDSKNNYAYVVENGKITSYNTGKYTLGNLSKLSTKEAIEKLKENTVGSVLKNYEEHVKHAQENNYQRELDDLQSFKSIIEKYYPKAYSYKLALYTDNSGNNTNYETVAFKKNIVKLYNALDDGIYPSEIKETEDAIQLHSVMGISPIYDKKFSGFVTKKKYLITQIEDDISFTLDQPNTKLKNISINE